MFAQVLRIKALVISHMGFTDLKNQNLQFSAPLELQVFIEHVTANFQRLNFCCLFNDAVKVSDYIGTEQC